MEGGFWFVDLKTVVVGEWFPVLELKMVVVDGGWRVVSGFGIEDGGWWVVSGFWG
jgi:hypothetical protein